MYYETLTERITNDSAHIVVMGLGYVGLPLAAELAKAGFNVTGYDPDPTKVERVLKGESYVDYPSSQVLDFLVKGGKLKATTSPTILNTADVVLICVPTPLNKSRDPDLSYVTGAVDLIVRHQHAGMLVVLESTTYPGTTRELLVPKLIQKYVLGEGVFVAYSPERIDPANPKYNLTNTPKVVAGVSPNCSRLVQRLYLKLNELVVPVTTTEVAEMAKVLENTFRAVNIGLVNELALASRKLGIDPFEVIDAAATKPFGFMPFYPGPGLGGHCIPLDPLYLSWKLKAVHGQARFIEIADTVNNGMPDHVVSVITEALNDSKRSVNGSRIHVLGVAYKPNVADVRESPVLPILRKLLKLGGRVTYQDPLIPKLEGDLHYVPNEVPETYRDYDLVVITTPHKEFDLPRIFQESNLIVDTRGVLRDQYNKTLKDPKVYRI